jgi:phosphoribosyl-ATP pyrophosphohydrolase
LGYHLKKIEKGTLGSVTKIREEYEEFMDAAEQDNPLMALHELSDLIGAVEAFAKTFNVTLDNLITMKEATQRAFRDGERN